LLTTVGIFLLDSLRGGRMPRESRRAMLVRYAKIWLLTNTGCCR
jgi:hypothetical protein